MSTTFENWTSESGVKRTSRVDPDGVITWQGTQDVSDLLRYTHEVRREGVDKKALLRPVASIPLPIYEELQREAYRDNLSEPEFQQRLRDWANDPHNRCFRLWEGRI